jgi:rubrerythrin
MMPRYDENAPRDQGRIDEVRQAIEHLRRPDAMLHERKVADMLEELLAENQTLERNWADAKGFITRNFYRQFPKPVKD